MIYTVTLNPSIDYVVQVENLQLGELNHSSSNFKLPGGKGINVSRILHQLNTDTTALGFIGGFTGEFITNWLQQDGIRTDFITIADDTRINIKLKSDSETEINDRGPTIREEEAQALLKKAENFTANDIVILSGSMPPSLPSDFYKQLIERFSAANVQFVIDTTGEGLKSSLPYQPFLIKPNVKELAQFFNVTLESNEAILHYGKQMINLGAQHVIVSMAGDGALLFTKDAIYQGISPKGTVRNSVGAGDSMVAGFIAEYHSSGNIESAFKMGLASGSATAFSDDLAKKNDILQLLEHVEVSRL